MHPERLWAITTFHPKTGKECTRTFKPDEHAKAREFIARADGKVNCYFNVNAPRAAVRKKTKKADHEAAHYLHVDIDCRAGEEHEAELERIAHLTTDDWPEDVPRPTVAIFSGGGRQLFWRLTKPETNLDLVERCNRTLINRLGGDNGTHNVDRVMRLAGTVNLPDEKKRRKGRAPAASRVLWADGPELDLGQIEPVPAAAPRESLQSAAVPLSAITQEHLDAMPPRLAALAVHGHDPEEPGRYPSRSEAVFDFLCNGLRADVPRDVLLGCLLDRDLGISAHVYDQKADKARYARKQLERAEAEVAHDEADFHLNDKGVPYPTQHNIRVALDRLGARLSYDQFADRLLIEDRHLSDAEVERLWLDTEARFGFRPGKDYYWTVVQDTARRAAFHPVLDYLDALQWDRQPRVASWLTRYCEAEDTPYTRAVGKLFLVAAVRRVRQPGCKFDEMMVLESPQGGFKSTALQTLAVQPDWFSDDLPLNADTKRVIESLAGRWIVEAAELKGMRKGDVEHLKAFLSRSIDRARMAYGRLVTEVPRQCVIVGTTNSERYLRDNTGNRRFWPVQVGKIDLPALKADRDQLWAEAARLEAEGESIRLPERLWQSAQLQQEDRRVEDPFVAILAEALGDRTGKIHSNDAWRIVGVPPGQRTQEHNLRIGEALKELGWDRTKRRFGGPPEWCYVKGTKRERQQRLQLELDPDDGSPRVTDAAGGYTDDDGIPF